MALMKPRGPRCFLVHPGVKNEDGSWKEKPAYLTYNDATPDEKAAHRKALLKAHEGNRGAFLDEEHAKAAAAVEVAFLHGRVESAHGFEVEEGVEGVPVRRELVWPTDKDRIIGLIPDGLLDLFRRTVDSLNFPHSFREFENASIAGSQPFPN